MSASRYARWQIRDYLVDGAPMPIVIAGLLFAAMLAIARGREGAGLDFSDPAMVAIFRTTLLLICVCLVLFAVKGMSSTDRVSGYYRLLFAKPVNVVRYYAQAFVLRGIAVSLIYVVLLAVAALLFSTRLPWSLLLAGPLTYLVLGGTAFLLSALTEHDVLYVISLSLVCAFAANQQYAIAYAFPPVWVLERFVSTNVAASATPTMAQGAGAAVYGLIAFAAGAYALQRRRFRS